jgi:hypothetical protein
VTEIHGAVPDPNVTQRALEYRRIAQMLITANLHDDYHLPRLLDEALDEVGPEAIMATLMGFIQAHTSSSSRSDANGRGMIDYLIRSTCRALDDLANERGVDAHDFIRSQLSATNSTSDEYHLVAQTLLATAFFPKAPASLYDQTLDVATPAYRRVGTAVIDLWFDAAFEALPASEWCVIKPLLESCVELILTYCQSEGSSPDEWVKTSWLISESLRV